MVVAMKVSAGLLMFRRRNGLEVLLAHPGGPFFRNKDAGAWGIPKGAPAPGEDLEAAAEREFTEEIGLPVQALLVSLGSIRQKGGKTVHAWAVEGDAPAGFVPKSNSFDLEWPPRSGRRESFPEVDRAEFFSIDVARQKITPAQSAFLDRLLVLLGP
jgi:predicted NUDIX family NTP pyrophosphohydrolase